MVPTLLAVALISWIVLGIDSISQLLTDSSSSPSPRQRPRASMLVCLVQVASVKMLSGYQYYYET